MIGCYSREIITTLLLFLCFLCSPVHATPVTNGLVAWWDASDAATITADANGRVSLWEDKSGSGNNGTQLTGSSQPTTGVDTINSLNVISFDADNEFIPFPAITTARTLFFVLKQDLVSSLADVWMGHTTALPYHRNSGYFLTPSADNNIENGDFRLNSTLVSPLVTTVPVDIPFQLTTRALGNVSVDQIAKDRTVTTTTWLGDIAEILIYDIALTDREMARVESYLNSKWGMASSSFAVDFEFPADNGLYAAASNTLSMKFSRAIDLQAGNISLYLSNGSLVEAVDVTGAQLSGNGSQFISVALTNSLIKGNSYYVNIDSTAVDDLTGASFAGISNNSGWNFSVNGVAALPVVNGLLLWLDAADENLITSDVNGRVSDIVDKSLIFNDIYQDTYLQQGKTGEDTINFRNVLSFDADGEYYRMLDYGKSQSFFIVLKDEGTGSRDIMFGHSSLFPFHRNAAPFLSASAWASIRSSKFRYNSTLIDPVAATAPLGQVFMVSSVVASSASVDQICLDRTSASTVWRGQVAEVLIYDSALTNGDVAKVENYLAVKWGFTDPNFVIDKSFPPDNGAFSAVHDKLLMEFSRPVDIQSGNLSLYLANGSLVEAVDLSGVQVTGNGLANITVDLTDSLVAGNSYYVNVPASAFDDFSGNSFAGLNGNSAWNFSVNGSHALSVTNGLSLWLDASDTSTLISDVNGRVSSIMDKSLSLNSINQTEYSEQPLTSRDTINSLNTLTFDADGQFFRFSDDGNYRSFFFMMYHNGAIGNSNAFIGHSTNFPFFRNSAPFLHSSAHNQVEFGDYKYNSVNITPTAVNAPEDVAFLSSVVTTSDVAVDQISRDRTSASTTWRGNISEILIFNKALSNGEVSKVEDYLSTKWGVKFNHSFSPADNSSGISFDSNLSISFVDNADILNGNLMIYRNNGSLFEIIDLNSAQVTGNGTSSISINPSKDLPAQENIYVNIEHGSFADLTNGNKAFPGFYDTTTWNFTVQGFSNSWTRNKKITILASQVNGDLNNFPVYIDLADMPADFFTTVNGTGADIRITKDDKKTQLAREVVDINTANGTGELWFKADFLSGTIDTDFYIWYGNSTAQEPSATSTHGSQAVWNNGFVGVWHLGQNPASGKILDSTSNTNNGTPNGSMNAADLVNGQIGLALDLDGSDDYINFADAAEFTGMNDLTLSAWGYSRSSGNVNKIISKDSSSNRSYYLGHYNLTTPSDGMRFVVSDDGSAVDVLDTSVAYPMNSWHFITAVYNGNMMKIFIDGSLENNGVTSNATGTIYDGNTDFSFGHTTFTADRWDGLIDEIRVMNLERSAEWINTEYNNQNSPSTFYEITEDSGGIFDWHIF